MTNRLGHCYSLKLAWLVENTCKQWPTVRVFNPHPPDCPGQFHRKFHFKWKKSDLSRTEIYKTSKPFWLLNWVRIARVVARFPQASLLRPALSIDCCRLGNALYLYSPVYPAQGLQPQELVHWFWIQNLWLSSEIVIARWPLRFAGGEGTQRRIGRRIFGTRPEGLHLKDLAFSGALVPPPPPAEETQAAGKRGCERELGLCRLTNGL